MDERFGFLGPLRLLLLLLILGRSGLTGRLPLLRRLNLRENRLHSDAGEKHSPQEQQDGPTCDVGEHRPRLESSEVSEHPREP
jgi:hypothetical protein